MKTARDGQESGADGAPSQVVGIFERLGRRLDRESPILIKVLATISLSCLVPLFQILISSSHGFKARFSAAIGDLVAVGLVSVAERWSSRRDQQLSTLQNQKEDLQEQVAILKKQVSISQGQLAQFQDVLHDWWNDRMREIARDLKLTTNERVSVYRHNSRYFALLGRHSDRPAFNGLGRVIYPDAQGCIAAAWQYGVYFVNGLPNPEKNLEAYCNRLSQEFGIPRETSVNFAMKSRSLAAFKIDGTRIPGSGAIIVLESIGARRWKRKSELQTALAERLTVLADHFNRFESLMPNLEIAREEGF